MFSSLDSLSTKKQVPKKATQYAGLLKIKSVRLWTIITNKPIKNSRPENLHCANNSKIPGTKHKKIVAIKVQPMIPYSAKN